MIPGTCVAPRLLVGTVFTACTVLPFKKGGRRTMVGTQNHDSADPHQLLQHGLRAVAWGQQRWACCLTWKGEQKERKFRGDNRDGTECCERQS